MFHNDGVLCLATKLIKDQFAVLNSLGYWKHNNASDLKKKNCFFSLLFGEKPIYANTGNDHDGCSTIEVGRQDSRSAWRSAWKICESRQGDTSFRIQNATDETLFMICNAENGMLQAGKDDPNSSHFLYTSWPLFFYFK